MTKPRRSSPEQEATARRLVDEVRKTHDRLGCPACAAGEEHPPGHPFSSSGGQRRQ